MKMIKRILAAGFSIYLVSGACAYAGGLFIEPVIGVAPAPVYAPPPPAVYAPPAYYAAPSPAYVAAPWVEGYDPYHRRHDWRYWHDHHYHDGYGYHH